ncbi:hypothetical protein F5B22DRAFT_365873 [Xylaria bambusicola]|uniref:uncharacterized protein n=1 Tax=Xylaria bambusicola TaxID=326684 RepID=UPI002007E20D|nr:uncharacterized protein F5B22DRAFT_365873 [Xylaria bambusicola]KAI0509193.1 hypothetical protein F5B22DRAFT_365873 [Xylaria bambusicola]
MESSVAPSMTSTLGVWHDAWGYIGAIIFLGVLSSITLALRFLARRLSRLGACSDDWLALFALIVQHGLGAVVIIAFLEYGVGIDSPDAISASPRASKEPLKFIFISTILYGTALTSIRLSAIMFILRIFHTKMVKRGGYILIVVSVAWFVVVEGLNLGICQPISYMWDHSIQGGQCLETKLGIVIPAAFSIIIDVAIVALPVHEVMKLRSSRAKISFVIGIFCIGGLAIGANFARLIAISLYLNQPPNGSSESPALLLATSAIEIYLTVIAACAPTLAPVYKRARGMGSPDDRLITHRTGYTMKPIRGQSKMNLAGGSRSGINRSAPRNSEDEERFLKRMDDMNVLYPARERGEFWTDISARPGSARIPRGKIRVQREVRWNSEV